MTLLCIYGNKESTVVQFCLTSCCITLPCFFLDSLVAVELTHTGTGTRTSTTTVPVRGRITPAPWPVVSPTPAARSRTH